MAHAFLVPAGRSLARREPWERAHREKLWSGYFCAATGPDPNHTKQTSSQRDSAFFNLSLCLPPQSCMSISLQTDWEGVHIRFTYMQRTGAVCHEHEHEWAIPVLTVC